MKTLTGVYTGQVQSEYSNVREFRYIPYAQPPVGPRRWVPPVALTPNSRHTYSYRFGPICPQYLGRNNSVWNSNITDFSVDIGGQSSTAGAAAQTASEDCLSLAIWTPLNASLEDRLPVTLFIPGGSFVTGGITVPYQQPAPMVSRRNEMIGITVNYRVNIMGFPNSAALEDQNLGILDLRMALEWVYANIANFGGDPERIVLWGQSAGGVAADMLGFAYHDNPLVKGYFLQSGTAAVKTIPADPTYSNFTFVARSLGCDFPDNKEAELACMKQLPVSQITNFVGQFRENNTDPGFNFQPVPDDKVVFNYSARAEAGLIPKGPALISTTANEASSLTKYPSNVTAGPDQTAVVCLPPAQFRRMGMTSDHLIAHAGTTDGRRVRLPGRQRNRLARPEQGHHLPLPVRRQLLVPHAPALDGSVPRRRHTHDHGHVPATAGLYGP